MKGRKHFANLLMIVAIIGLFTPLAAWEKTVEITANPTQLQLMNNSEYGFELQATVGKLNLKNITNKAGNFDELSIPGYGFSSRIGEAKLPVISKIFAVPLGAEVSFEILANDSRELSSAESGLSQRIIPVQESVSKSADPNSIRFELNESWYRRNELSRNPLFSIEEIGMMRGQRLFQFYYEPLRYNPVLNTLQLCTSAFIQVRFANPDLAATEAALAKTASAEFEALYAKTIFNWDQSSRSSLVRHPSKILILCPPAYSATMTPYVEFKRKQGYIVNLVTVGSGATISNSTTAIQNYMQGLWNAATAQDPAPTYLIIVGDHGSSGNNITANAGATSSHITDLNYVRLNGTDYLPEMYFGRFSVSNTTELNNVINKTLMFAQTSMPDLSYLNKTVLIAGVDASWAPTHGNGAINYATTHYFNADHGISSNNYFYPASGSSAAQIVANAAEGRGYLNYTAHGSQTAWHDPSFTASQMMSLGNTNKPFVAVGNCCITNEFDYGSPCFGEAIIRSNNAGAAYIGGTNSTYWDEDYYWAVGYKTPQTNAHPYDPNKLGAYDAMFHAPSSVNDWAQTMGETMFMGNMAVQASTSSRKNYYWEIYSLMGDPSLMPYYGVPTVNSATFPPSIMLGMDSINITAEPYSRVALSMNGTLYASDIVPASGSLTLSFSPFSTVGSADLIFTCSGKITRQETIEVLPASGAYLSVESNQYADSNNNQPDYNESGRFNTTFKNVGADTANDVTATLSCATTGITITDATEIITALAAGASVTRNNAFAFNIANNIADGSIAEFTITMVSGTSTWTSELSLELNAPALSFGALAISDPSGNNNGRLDPGETVSIIMPILNNGGAASLAGIATMSCSTAGITINNGSYGFTALSAGGSQALSFSLSASSTMSIGSIANLTFNAGAGAYSAGKNESLVLGLILEDFESGDFSSYPWIMGGSQPWTVVDNEAYEGTYAARSGAIDHSQTSSMSTTRILNSTGTLRFRYKVSSESGYDYLKFYIDGVQQDMWSGTIGWSEASYELAEGTRELSWQYSKDSSVSNGEDCAWVDYVIFPASNTPSSFYPPQNLRATPGDGRISLTWEAPAIGSPSSYRVYRNGSLLALATTLSYHDNAVTNGTPYSYYVVAVYASGESDPSNTVTSTPGTITEAILGSASGTTGTSTASPINVYYKSSHGQSIYTASEMAAAGITGPVTITHLGFKVVSAPTYALPNFVIRMKHSSSTDASTWQSATDMITVYSNTGYAPEAGDYDLLTLDTPFLWNGVDNIVVDTAFGTLSAYHSSGTIEYTLMNNGYRYVRSDSADQRNIFSGGSTSTFRPDIKIRFEAPLEEEANIAVSPASLSFEDTAIGQSSSETLRISNTGNSVLTGSITSPTGFSINQSRSDSYAKAGRNTLSFSIAEGAYRDYEVLFSPASSGAYSGNIIINSNAVNTPSLNVAVSGSGYIPPTIALSTQSISSSLLIGETGSDSFSITNTGGQALNYNITLSEARGQSLDLAANNSDRSIAGSYLSVDPDAYVPGTTMDWAISVYNASTDTEWIKEVILTLPAGITINEAEDMTGGTAAMIPTIDGNTITWFGETSEEWGVIQGSQTGTATINISIPADQSGDLALAYTINGDVYGADPHSIMDSFIISMDTPVVEWLSLSSYSGTLAPDASTQITASFSAAGMSIGAYNAMIRINSNDPEHPLSVVAANMEVLDVSNHPPVIDLPESFSFDKNDALTLDLSSYASDPDDDPLTLQIAGNSNVLYTINGMEIRLSATQNWVGSETLTFIVSDGELSADDQVQVTVLPVNQPDWAPVIYPNNPATIYAKVSINGYPAQTNDWVAAFVGDQCRGTAQIVLGRDNAYATIIVQLAEAGETVYFRVYSHASDTVYDANISVEADFGEEIGLNEPIIINAEPLSALDTPQPSISFSQNHYILRWDSVLHADYYEVYSSDRPDGDFQLIHTTTARTYPVSTNMQRRFFRVKAIKGLIAK